MERARGKPHRAPRLKPTSPATHLPPNPDRQGGGYRPTQSRRLVHCSITPTKTQSRARQGALTNPNELQPRPHFRSNCQNRERGAGVNLHARVTCPLKTNPNLERESKDSGVCKEAGNDEEAIHERTDYPQAEGSRS